MVGVRSLKFLSLPLIFSISCTLSVCNIRPFLAYICVSEGKTDENNVDEVISVQNQLAVLTHSH